MNEKDIKAALDDLTEYLVEILNEKEAVIVSQLLGNLLRALGYPKNNIM